MSRGVWDLYRLIFGLHVFIHSTVSKCLNEGCIITVKKDFPDDNEPFLLKQNGSKFDYFLPKFENNEDIYCLNHKEKFVLACPIGRNYVNVTKQAIQEVICQEGTLEVNGIERNLRDLRCRYDVGQFALNTNKQCARGNGTVIEIGFQAEGWHTVLTACHNIDLGMTYYVTHTLYRDLINGGVYKRSSFKKEAPWLFRGYDPNKSYKRANQIKVFRNILDNSTSQYINRVNYISRGHLCPVRDFPFTSWQQFTFVYSNAAPQWQSINGGSWAKMESSIRSNLKTNVYNIATGTYGNFKIENSEGEEVEISLERGKIPVPEYFWKIAQDPKDESCIVFVSTNDPFLQSPPVPICSDLCAASNWPTFQKNLTQGYVYCCDYNDFKRVVIDVPKFNCKTVLNYVKYNVNKYK